MDGYSFLYGMMVGYAVPKMWKMGVWIWQNKEQVFDWAESEANKVWKRHQ